MLRYDKPFLTVHGTKENKKTSEIHFKWTQYVVQRVEPWPNVIIDKKKKWNYLTPPFSLKYWQYKNYLF